MKYLLDTSSLILLIKKADVESAVEMLNGAAVLDLTYYELGNVIWKESSLSKFLTPKEAESLGVMAQEIITKTDQIRCLGGAFLKILEIARNESLSFYDSSYLFTAKDRGFTLTTEDRKLRTKAKKYIEVSTAAELAAG